MNKNNICNNCGKQGHKFHQCKFPITSYGIILFRHSAKGVQYLMIRRKDTFGYIDFIRGKYSVQNENYILNMLKQMTTEEKELLKNHDFDTLWNKLWGNNFVLSKYKSEETLSKEKFTILKNGLFIKEII
jgi:hypothetical protein